VRYAPDESDLRATVRKIDALWQAIERARSTGDWRPRPSRLCSWCAHQAICPAFGGTPPPLPQEAPAAATSAETERPAVAVPPQADGPPRDDAPAPAGVPPQPGAPDEAERAPSITPEIRS
jgi:putative RecB family exonuclease